MQKRKPIKSPTPPIPPNSPKQLHQRLKSVVFITMAALFSITLISLLLFFVLSAAAARHHNGLPKRQDGGVGGTTVIAEACKASRDPTTCQSALAGHGSYANPATVLQAVQAALDVSGQNLKTGREMVQTILTSASGNDNLTNAANTCLEVLGYSEHRTNLAAEALPRGAAMKDARAWTSAAMVYQYDCWSALKYVNTTSLVNETMSFFYSPLMKSTADSLAMMLNYDVYGEKTDFWGPVKTERDGFWETGSENPGSNGFAGGGPKELKPDITVCKNGYCNYQTVQEAVNAAPENNIDAKFVVWIKEGIYEEIVRVPLEKRNVVLLGDGMGKTVITNSLNVGLQGVSTYNSATVGVVGDGFMASGLTIKNTAGPDAHQAVAFRSDSDLSVIESCEFIGNQDTLYSHSLRQYYKSCKIQGNVDFIFGNSAAIFQDCIILVAPRQLSPEKGENNALTAHGRIDPGQTTGFVFQNCAINGTDSYMALYYKNPRKHKNFLGRPWKEYSRTVFLQCNLEALVSPEGWLPWSGDFALGTLYYGEFENTGPGSGSSGRVAWSSRVPPERAYSYSVGNFIQGDQWIPTSS